MIKTTQEAVSRIKRFFPFALPFSHIRRNPIAVFLWLLLILLISGNFGAKYGIRTIFYDPEYMGNTTGASFFVLGIAFSVFITAINTYTFSRILKRYPFLLVLRNPFYTYCKNNFILPTLLIGIFCGNLYSFQINEQLASPKTAIYYIICFILGFIGFLFFVFAYFIPFSSYFSKAIKPFLNETEREESELIQQNVADEIHYFYLQKIFNVRRGRTILHIHPTLQLKLSRRNKISTTLFEFIIIILFVLLSITIESEYFIPPAGVSILILLTLIFMVYSTLSTWFGGWTYAIIFVISFIIYQVNNYKPMAFKNFALGLDYNSLNAPEYSNERINQFAIDSLFYGDKTTLQNQIAILNNWKKNTNKKKPKLVLIATSGGGSRASLWTYHVFQNLYKEIPNELPANVHLITGASGGLVGASYFRQLLIQKEEEHLNNYYIHDQSHFNNLSKDLLNKLTHTASTRDLFIRTKKVKQGHNIYIKDRGFAWEEQLNANTNNLLDRNLGYYSSYERSGLVPLIVFTPTIVNDGRKLIISSQSMRFIQSSHPYTNFKTGNNYVDFQSYFEGVSPQSLYFPTAIRTSATFPVVMPMISIPSTPEIRLADAGVRDNYGITFCLDYIYSLQDWINNNTSGVIIIQIRDTRKVLDKFNYDQLNLFQKLMLPFSLMTRNFTKTQDLDQDALLKMSSQAFKFPLDVVTFNLRETTEDQIALSWHLSNQEKELIKRRTDSESNLYSLKRLKELLK